MRADFGKLAIEKILFGVVGRYVQCRLIGLLGCIVPAEPFEEIRLRREKRLIAVERRGVGIKQF